MKKTLLVLGMCLLLTGCGSGKITCTREFTNEDGYQVKDEMIVEYDNYEVTKVINTNITETEEAMTDLTISFGEIFSTSLNTIDGINLEYSKQSDTEVKYIMSVDFKNLDIDKLKDQFKDDFDDTFYSSKTIKIKDFKKQNLKDYKCK